MLDALNRMQEWVKDLMQQRIRAWKDAMPNLRAYQAFMQEDSAAMQEMLVKAISALRKELHLDPGEAELLALLTDTRKRAMEAIDNLLKPS
jgi:hypothetical protein